MASRLLSGAERAVIEAIFDQRAKSQWSSIFEYSPEEAQLFLHETGAFSKFGLSKDKQYAIINKLTDEGIIKSDYLVDVKFTNNYRSATQSELPLIESSERCLWLRNTEWAREYFGPNEHLSADKLGETLGGAIVINMTPDDMRLIERQYISNRSIRLTMAVDADEYVLKIKFDAENWHEILRMKNTKATAKILYKAFKNADNETRVGQRYKYLLTRVFVNCTIVKALNPTLIELGVGKIIFRTHAAVPLEEYERIRGALGIA